MRSLSADLAQELGKQFYKLCHLITITVSSALVYRWTDSDQDILYGGNWYSPKNFVFDVAQYSIQSKSDSISFEIDNVDKSFSDLALGTDIRGKEITIYVLGLDNNLQPVGTSALIFWGYLDAIEINRKRARVTVYNHLIKWRTNTPRRIHQSECTWQQFKSTECNWSGAVIDFTSGGSCEITVGTTMKGCTSTSYAIVESIVLSSGAWATGDAAGSIFFHDPDSSGKFIATDVLSISANTSEGDLGTVSIGKYSTTWCDRTYARCQILTNTTNFGGFRFINDLIDKEIWWGEARKSWTPLKTYGQ